MKDNASRTRTAALAAALLLTTSLGPAGGAAQTADFTIQTAIAAILEWGSQAKDFS